eukprot:TRINITY_DN135104_c0_g1_i1.p1 TRINITY_DN135104_c0_g1~~TRINITY_DN135104_c0_g1_i1.p1  ORF type:complete len:165 (+),score=4.22 TRINITY_DN135104_c0_g1_i1:30-497(+)
MEADSPVPSHMRRHLLAVPKKGRLHEQCMKMLAGCGLECVRHPRLDIAHCTNLNITLVFLSAIDIPKFVGQGNVDFGITGQDTIGESSSEVAQVLALGFGKCTLAVQAPLSSSYACANDLRGKTVVTSYPNLSRKFFGDTILLKLVQRWKRLDFM